MQVETEKNNVKIFITGATGFIGGVLLEQLTRENHTLRVLYRKGSEHKITLTSPNIRYIPGNILDRVSLKKAMKECTHVFHLAACASVWAPAPSQFYRINVEGTRNVLSVAQELGIQKVVITSTAATLPASNGKPIDETAVKDKVYTDYEQSKLFSEKLANEYSSNGLATVVVNPPRVFGPGKLSESNAITKIIKWYVQGKWWFIPGDGSCTGNYAYVKDVVQGHILAMEKGKPGRRYILGGTNLSFNELFEHLSQVSGIKRSLIPIPLPFINGMSHVEEYKARFFNIPPLLTPSWVDKYFRDWQLSSDRASNELGYKITPIREALAETVAWIRERSRQKLR